MQSEDMFLCGFILDEVGEINEVYARPCGEVMQVLYLGVGSAMRVVGFKDVELMEISKWVRGNSLSVSEEYSNIRGYVEKQLRGLCYGVLKINGGFLFVKDLDWENVSKQSERKGAYDDEIYMGIEDISCVDDDEEDYTDLMDELYATATIM